MWAVLWAKAESKSKHVHQVLLELAGRPGWTGMPPQDSLGANIINRKHLSAAMEASIEELETDLLQVTGLPLRVCR